MVRLTQKEMVLAWLQEDKSITSYDSFAEFGFLDLQSIVMHLRRDGHDVRDKWIHKLNRYGHPVKFKEYWLVKPEVKSQLSLPM